MWKQGKLCLAILAAVGFAGSLPAQDKPSNYEQLKPMEWIIGEWQWDGEWRRAGEEPEPFVYRATFQWALGKNFIEQTVSQLDAEGRAEVVQKGVLAWDSTTQKIVAWGFWKDNGTFERVRLSPLEGSRVRVTREGLHGMFEAISDTSYRYAATFEEDDGREGSWSLKATRLSGSPSESPAYEHLKIFEPIIGSSTGEFEEPTYRARGMQHAEWGEGKGCILIREEFQVPKQVAAQNPFPERVALCGILGWDPSEKKYVLSYHSNWGLSMYEQFTVEGDKLVSQARLVSNGDVTQLRSEWTISEDGSQKLERKTMQGEFVHQLKWNRAEN